MKNTILNTKNILALSVLAATSVTSVNVFAEGTGHGTVTVSVKNSFEVKEEVALKFGIVRATASAVKTTDATDAEVLKQTASMAMSPIDGAYATSANAGGASIAALGNGTPAVFSMAKVGAYKNFTLTAADIELKKAGSETNDASFLVSDFQFYIVAAVDATSGTLYDGSSVYLKSNADGDAFFRVGATLSTSTKLTDDQSNYEDTDYAGAYDVKVNYK